ncbi:MAG: coproporphyrinogen dehydrogenase HemZ [Clostridia bacterium]|nr:coproporphyrinogen dehydrogenase HemZ [Clostridia bacterium]
MIVKTEGNINKYYVQSLCMLFFPGAKFADGEEERAGVPVVQVSLREAETGVEAFASIKLDKKMKTGSRFEKYKKNYTKNRTAKIAVGIAVFEAGKRFFGTVPPWGILTGVRPAKIAAEMLDSGMDFAAVKKTLEKEYFLNPKKSNLVTEIATVEKEIIDSTDENACSVYISIPFCPSRCAYCSFVSYATPRLLSLIPDYLERLKSDIDRMFDTIERVGKKVVTVYIGGGTPTTLDENQLEELLSKIAERVDVTTLKEFTLEAGRPDTVTKEKLDVAAKYGVTRVSINPQTLNDNVLKQIVRKHTAEDFFKAYNIARESNIKYINTDLIAGLPGDTFAGFSKTVDEILKLSPDNLTVHTFCVKKSADILRYNSDIYSRAGGDTPKSVSYALLKSKNAGYVPYYIYRQKNTVGNLENVGYAKPGSEGLYNIYMMEDVHSVFACGAGGVTKLISKDKEMKRVAFPKYPYEYLDMNKEPEKIDDIFEQITSFFEGNE